MNQENSKLVGDIGAEILQAFKDICEGSEKTYFSEDYRTITVLDIFHRILNRLDKTFKNLFDDLAGYLESAYFVAKGCLELTHDPELKTDPFMTEILINSLNSYFIKKCGSKRNLQEEDYRRLKLWLNKYLMQKTKQKNKINNFYSPVYVHVINTLNSSIKVNGSLHTLTIVSLFLIFFTVYLELQNFLPSSFKPLLDDYHMFRINKNITYKNKKTREATDPHNYFLYPAVKREAERTTDIQLKKSIYYKAYEQDERCAILFCRYKPRAMSWNDFWSGKKAAVLDFSINFPLVVSEIGSKGDTSVLDQLNAFIMFRENLRDRHCFSLGVRDGILDYQQNKEKFLPKELPEIDFSEVCQSDSYKLIDSVISLKVGLLKGNEVAGSYLSLMDTAVNTTQPMWYKAGYDYISTILNNFKPLENYLIFKNENECDYDMMEYIFDTFKNRVIVGKPVNDSNFSAYQRTDSEFKEMKSAFDEDLLKAFEGSKLFQDIERDKEKVFQQIMSSGCLDFCRYRAKGDMVGKIKEEKELIDNYNNLINGFIAKTLVRYTQLELGLQEREEILDVAMQFIQEEIINEIGYVSDEDIERLRQYLNLFLEKDRYLVRYYYVVEYELTSYLFGFSEEDLYDKALNEKFINDDFIKPKKID